jgi:hypothetical protein
MAMSSRARARAGVAGDQVHLDHRDYYEPFMNEYRNGGGRGRFLDDLANMEEELWRAGLARAHPRPLKPRPLKLRPLKRR